MTTQNLTWQHCTDGHDPAPRVNGEADLVGILAHNFDRAPFLIGQVGLVSVRLANMLLSGGWGPHGNSEVGLSNPLESRRHQPLNTFRNGL